MCPAHRCSERQSCYHWVWRQHSHLFISYNAFCAWTLWPWPLTLKWHCKLHLLCTTRVPNLNLFCHFILDLWACKLSSTSKLSLWPWPLHCCFTVFITYLYPCALHRIKCEVHVCFLSNVMTYLLSYTGFWPSSNASVCHVVICGFNIIAWFESGMTISSAIVHSVPGIYEVWWPRPHPKMYWELYLLCTSYIQNPNFVILFLCCKSNNTQSWWPRDIARPFTTQLYVCQLWACALTHRPSLYNQPLGHTLWINFVNKLCEMWYILTFDLLILKCHGEPLVQFQFVSCMSFSLPTQA